MKKLMMIVAVAAAFVAPSATDIFAQTPAREPYCRIKPPGNRVDPARVRQAAEAEMFDDLRLTESQIAEVKKNHENSYKDAQKRQEKALKQLKKDQEKFLKKMKKTLTPVQYEKFVAVYFKDYFPCTEADCQGAKGDNCLNPNCGHEVCPEPTKAPEPTGSVSAPIEGPKQILMTQ